MVTFITHNVSSMVQSCSQQLIRCLVRCGGDEQFAFVCTTSPGPSARGTATGGGPELDGALGLGARYTFPECRDPDPSLKRQIPRAAQVSIFGPEATLLPNRSNALRSSSFEHRARPRYLFDSTLAQNKPKTKKLATGSRVAAHTRRRCVRRLHPLPENVYSSRIVST